MNNKQIEIIFRPAVAITLIILDGLLTWMLFGLTDNTLRHSILFFIIIIVLPTFTYFQQYYMYKIREDKSILK